MKYIEICERPQVIFPISDTGAAQECIFSPMPKILVWSANHETAIFDVNDEVHPASVVVWFQMIGHRNGSVSEKYELKDDRWRLVEQSFGKITYRNYNPFEPHGRDAASNTAASVFPQNQFAR